MFSFYFLVSDIFQNQIYTQMICCQCHGLRNVLWVLGKGSQTQRDVRSNWCSPRANWFWLVRLKNVFLINLHSYCFFSCCYSLILFKILHVLNVYHVSDTVLSYTYIIYNTYFIYICII